MFIQNTFNNLTGKQSQFLMIIKDLRDRFPFTQISPHLDNHPFKVNPIAIEFQIYRWLKNDVNI